MRMDLNIWIADLRCWSHNNAIYLWCLIAPQDTMKGLKMKTYTYCLALLMKATNKQIRRFIMITVRIRKNKDKESDNNI